MAAKANIIGLRFGRLVAREMLGRQSALFVCECGTEKNVRIHSVITGATQSCGCLGRERRAAACTTHGGSKERLYKVWEGMKGRCLNPNFSRYELYGGSGITVCEEWLSYSAFRDWALANGYAAGLSIDRIDGSKGYCPSNCRWATAAQQNRNLRSNRRVLFRGRSWLVRDLAFEFRIHPNTLQARLSAGADIATAISKPVVYKKRVRAGGGASVAMKDTAVAKAVAQGSEAG